MSRPIPLGTTTILKRIIRQGWDYKHITALVLLFTLTSSALIGYQGKLLVDLLNILSSIQVGQATGAEDTSRAIAQLKQVSLIILALAPIVGGAAYGAVLTGQYLANRCMRDLRNRFLAHLIRQELAFHVSANRGDIIQRMTSDLNALFTLQTVLFSKLLQRPVEVLALVGFLFWLSWQFTLALFLVMLPIGALIGTVLKKVRRRSKEANDSMAASVVLFEQITAGVRVIKAMGSTEREVERYQGANQDLFNQRQRMVRARAQSDGVTQGSVMLITAAGMGFGAFLFERSWITPMALLTVLAVLGRIANSLREVQRAWGDVLECIPAAERAYELLDRTSRVVDRPGATPCPVPTRAITLEQVRFSYAADAEEVLRGIDLTVPVGRTVALVGESGGGKSTILDLIPRFHEVTGGAIRIDGADIRDRQLDSLVRHVAIVSQDSFLFNDTVYNNIAYGRPGATRAEVEQAATRAHIHHAILALEGGKGYDTPVGDRGGQLSGGQRQRVAIARALLRDAPILLLDEPTSALDADSESHVQAALKELMQGRTTIVVAHRLATVQHADLIVVLAGKDHPARGTVLEQGTHGELVAKGGEYARLVRMQQLAV
jgi:subfamily B ATP-binding cassette protein MsbA